MKDLLAALQKVNDLATADVAPDEFGLQLDRIKVVIEEAKIKAGVPASQPRKESRNTRCARRIAARIKQAKQ